MAKVAPKKASAAEAEAAPAKPVKSAKLSSYKMHRSGVAEGASGTVYKFKAGDVIQAPSGDLDHLGERHCEKK